MNDDELGFIRRYAAVLRPEAVYDTVVAMDAARPNADPKLAPDDERRAVQLSGEDEDNMGKLRTVLRSDEDEDEDMEQLRELIEDACRRSRPRREVVYRTRRRAKAADARPESDLEFYTRCAKASTQLT
jgi:hypothetical protein